MFNLPDQVTDRSGLNADLVFQFKTARVEDGIEQMVAGGFELLKRWLVCSPVNLLAQVHRASDIHRLPNQRED